MIPDGYYLSAYLHIDTTARAIDWWLRHDQNFSLWRKSGVNIELVRYWELERFTGEKQHRTPFRSMADALALIGCALRDEGLDLQDLRAIFGTPGLDTIRGYDSLVNWPNVPYHTMCHLFSTLPVGNVDARKNTTLALALDGGPDRLVDGDSRFDGEYAAAVFRNGSLDVVPINFSPGRLWYLAREKFGRREGTLMALQTACRATLAPDGKFANGEGIATFDAACAYLNEVWRRCSDAMAGDEDVINYDDRFSLHDNRVSMYVKRLHALSISYLESLIVQLLNRFKIDPTKSTLAMSGGYALNCPTNSYLMSRFGFAHFLSSPCVNDAGISLGAAAYYFHHESGGSVEVAQFGADVGRSYTSVDWESEFRASEFVSSISDLDHGQWLADIQRAPIVWFSGRAEIGPRALGFRSLLGDPRHPETRDILNRVKSREWWRPVAPIVIEECAQEWFDNVTPSPHMLLTSAVRLEKASLIPAVVHLDGTARLQTASIRTHPVLYPLLRAFYDATGIPMLANTSLNARDEPIVCAPAEALRFAVSRGIEILYVDGRRIELDLTVEPRDEREKMKPLSRPWASAFARSNVDDLLLQEYLQDGVLSRRDIALFCRLPTLRTRFDLHSQSDRSALAALCFQLHSARADREFESTAHEFYARTAERLLEDRSGTAPVISQAKM